MLKKDKSLLPDAIEAIRHQTTEQPQAASETIRHAGTYLCCLLFGLKFRFSSFCISYYRQYDHAHSYNLPCG